MWNNEPFDENWEAEEYDDCLDGLLGSLAALPQETVRLLDLSRYSQMLAAAARLTGILRESGEGEELSMDVDQLFRYGAIRTELDSLTVKDTGAFMEVIALADNFEVYPLTDGRVCLSITFQNILKTIA